MLDPSELIAHWGYLAVFLFVILGNVGVPVPEETILALAGYLVWRGQLRLPLLLVVGIISAAVGDNLGYWIGRRYGRAAIERYGQWALGTPGRLESLRRFVERYGPLGVFVGRFIPGLRFLAGPLAGATGLRPLPFAFANILGALIYVPLIVGIGYAVGYGFGEYIERLRRIIGEVERLVLIAAIVFAIALLGWRALRACRMRRGS